MLTDDLPFFMSPPRTIGELERGLLVSFGDAVARGNDSGSFYAPPIDDRLLESPPALSSDVTSVTARYSWDMYHSLPCSSMDELRAKRLVEYSISFTRGVAACEAWLASHHGAPRSVVEAGSNYRVYGVFLVLAYSDGSFRLDWHERLPDWAVPAPNRGTRMTFLAAIPDLLATAHHDDVVAFASKPPEGSGILVTGRLNPGDFWLGFAPKPRAVEVAAALGIAEPVGISTDFHMSSWRLVSLREGRASEIEIGKWRVEVVLADWPTGADVTTHYHCKRLGPSDLVYSLGIGRASTQPRLA